MQQSVPGSQLSAATVMRRADVLALISEESECLTRRFGTPAMRQANETVAGWMREAGMSVRQDNIGNLIGRYEMDEEPALSGAKGGRACPERSEGTKDGRGGAGNGPTLVLGSHLDTVRDAGKYD